MKKPSTNHAAFLQQLTKSHAAFQLHAADFAEFPVDPALYGHAIESFGTAVAERQAAETETAQQLAAAQAEYAAAVAAAKAKLAETKTATAARLKHSQAQLVEKRKLAENTFNRYQNLAEARYVERAERAILKEFE